VNEKHTRNEREAYENKRKNESDFKFLLFFSVLRVNIFVSFFNFVLPYIVKLLIFQKRDVFKKIYKQHVGFQEKEQYIDIGKKIGYKMLFQQRQTKNSFLEN